MSQQFQTSMSTGQHASQDGTYNRVIGQPQPLQQHQLFRPSRQDWQDYREIITDLYEDEQMQYNTLAAHMRTCYGFNATPRMYFDRLHNSWGCRRNMDAKTKDELCYRLFDDNSNGRDTSYIGYKELQKLIRHVKKKSPVNSEILDVLQSLERIQLSSSQHSGFELQEPSTTDADTWTVSLNHPLSGQQREQDTNALSVPTTFDADDVVSDTSDFSILGATGGSGTHLEQDTFSSISQDSTGEATMENITIGRTDPPHMPPSLVNEFDLIADRASDGVSLPIYVPLGGSALGLDRLLHLTRTYFTGRLQAITVESTNSAASPYNTLVNNPSKSFWTSIKSAIYFLKKGEDSRAYPMLHEAGYKVVQVCATQSVSLLRELLTTLSNINTSICPGLRAELLRLFARSAYRPGQIDPYLHKICLLLQEKWVNDEALTVILCMILRVAEDHPDLLVDEIPELQRSRIQLLRRRKDLEAATYTAASARQSLETLFGADSVQTRLIMSEQIYVLNEQNRHEEALGIALDMVNRANRFEDDDTFPSQRSIYHMEDLAEIYERLSRPKEARFWLRRALRAALNNWDSKSSTIHLYDKLEKLEVYMETVGLEEVTTPSTT